MTCEQAEWLVLNRRDDELSNTELVAICRHLRTCESCQQRLQPRWNSSPKHCGMTFAQAMKFLSVCELMIGPGDKEM